MSRLLSDTGSDITSFDHPTLNAQIISSVTNKITLDNFSNWYFLEDDILVGFPLLNKYDNIIRNGATLYEIKDEHFLRPEYVSYELYGTTDLWYVLLYLNNMVTVNEFTKKHILVPPARIARDIGRLIINEGKLISDKFKPRKIKKHYIKRLNEPSTSILVDDPDNVSPWMETTNTSSKKDKLLEGEVVFTESKSSDNRDYVIDPYDRKVPRFTLDPKGMTSIPSCYYKNGFSRTYKSRIRLLKGRQYSFNKYMNGYANFKVFDRKNVPIVNLDMFNDFRESILIYDYRSSAEIDYAPTITGDDKIEFDSFNGNYFIKLLNKKIADFSDRKNIKHQDDLVNLERLVNSENVFINLEYSLNLEGNANVEFHFDYRYEGERTDRRVIIKAGKSIINTHNVTSWIKTRIPYLNKKLIGLTFKAVLVGNTASTVNSSRDVDLKIKSIDISTKDDSDIRTQFAVSQSGWYDMEMTYTYKTWNEQTNRRIFKDDSFEGIYFNPTITELKLNGRIDHLRNVEIKDFPKNITPKHVKVFYKKNKTVGRAPTEDFYVTPLSLTVADGRVPQNDELNNKFISMTVSENFKFPRKYIMELTVTPMSETGGCGIILDYNDIDKTGYMIWVTKAKGSDGNVYGLNVDRESGYRIMKPGLYELDDIYGEGKIIYEDDDSNFIKVSNYYPILPETELLGSTSINYENIVMKIIKKENRLKLYVRKPDGTYDYLNPVIDIEDINNFHTNGRLAFMNVHESMTGSIIDYITWDESSSKEDNEW